MLIALVSLSLSAPAHADLTHGVDDVTAIARTQVTKTAGSAGSDAPPSTESNKTSSSDRQQAARKAGIELQRQIAAYMKSLDAWQACLSQTPPGGSAPSCQQLGSPPFRATLPTMLGTGSGQLTLSPEQVAYIAFARLLHLDPLEPVIGPPPEIN